jgi:hypothetical protein
MMPIATISLVTADQLSCWLTAADDLAWPECASSARNDHSFLRESQSIRLIAPIVCPFWPSSPQPSRTQRALAAPSAPAKSP